MTKTRGWKTWAALVALVFVAAAQSWGACRYVERTGYFIDYACYPTRPSSSYIEDGVCVLSSAGTERDIGLACVSNETSSVILSCEKACNGQNHGAPRIKGYCCSNQCEADSVANGGFILECQFDVESGKYYRWICPGDLNCSSCGRQFYTDQTQCQQAFCQDNPDAPGCEQEKDTTLFACSDLGNGKSGLYRLACRALGGSVVSCNGKTDVNVETDGTLIREQNGTCAQNGFQNGIFGGASADSAQQQTADCFATIGSKCFMKDRNSGNTYTCECDGSCEYAVRQLATGSGCANPYPQPESSGGINLSSWNEAQSSAQQPQSSASEPGSSADIPGSSASEPGSSGSAEPPMSDFEYDYTDVLNDIRANTQYTGTQLNNLNDKANTANILLERIANKNVSPVVNVDARDTINVNVQVNGDTARSGAAILALLQEKMGGEPDENDTAGLGGQLEGLLSQLDSTLNEGTPDMSDSIGGAVSSYRGAYNAFKDSVENSAWGDSVDKWENTLLNNGVISGSGSDACPAVLQRTWDVGLGIAGNVTFGPLGKYLCAVVPGAGVTFWALARVLLRALVSIACMVWLFKAVMGIDEGGSSEED